MEVRSGVFKGRKGSLNQKQRQLYMMKLRKSLNEFKLIQRLYRNIQDKASLNEEMTREFELLRQNFKGLQEMNESVMESNLNIMRFLNIEEERGVSVFTKK